MLIASSSDIIWSPIFDKYRHSLVKSTEACDEYHLFALHAALGCLIGRTIHTPYGRKLYPNFMIVLVGESAIARKTTAQRFAMDIFERMSKKTGRHSNTLSSLSSAEGLLRALGAGPVDEDRIGIPTLISIEEFSTLLRKARQETTSNLTPVLTELYDLPAKSVLPRVKQPLAVRLPYFCMLGGTTPSWLESSLNEEEVLGGFCNRFLYCVGEPKAEISSPSEPNYHIWDEIINQVCEVSAFWEREPTRTLHLTPDAEVVWDSYYKEWREVKLTGLMAILRERLPEYARKLALIDSWLRMNTKIEFESIMTGISVARYAEASLKEVFSVMTLGDREQKCERRIVSALEGKSPMKHRELQQWMSGLGFSAHTFNQAYYALEKCGIIRTSRDENTTIWTNLE